MTRLRLVLGDQLNPLHPWFEKSDPHTVFCLMELRQETDHVLHHAQKVLAIFAAMRAFAERLRKTGHRVIYLGIDDTENRHTLDGNLNAVAQQLNATEIEYQWPDDWRVDHQLAEFAKGSSVPVHAVDTHHFLTDRNEVAALFKGRKQWLMERFYQHMRVKHTVLVDSQGEPEGGRWNFDAENRKPWRGTPPEPPDLRHGHDHSALWQQIRNAGIQTWGTSEASALRWPLDREEALQQLDAFIQTGLPYFGEFQDAMHAQAPRLFHALISFALNLKMISPRDVVDRAVEAYRSGAAPLQSVEGFVRQVLGWREYIRGVYWARMPDYAHSNFFDHTAPLPQWYWSGDTGMRCLSVTVRGVRDTAYAHHIQRLMVTGNFALLAGVAPHEVHRWYLGVFIDAIEWVELPNTLGMSQFADGGALATKPYVSSAAYIDRMSDYCNGCRYRRKERYGPDACPFNALYWGFFDRNADRLSRNPRLGMVYRQLQRMSADELSAIRRQTEATLGRLDAL